LCLTAIGFENRVNDVGSKIMGMVVDGNIQARDISCCDKGHWAKFNWALSMLWNMRGTRTRWAIKNIPGFSKTDKNYVPSRIVFLLHHLQVLVVTYVILDAFAHQPPDADIMLMLSATKQHLFSRYWEITGPELVIRASIVFAFWLNTTCIVAMIHSMLAVVHVGLHISEPAQWPPIFGPISQAYTVRQFWG
jgi:hypothetical protein